VDPSFMVDRFLAINAQARLDAFYDEFVKAAR
jgi:hypothetical protein